MTRFREEYYVPQAKKAKKAQQKNKRPVPGPAPAPRAKVREKYFRESLAGYRKKATQARLI